MNEMSEEACKRQSNGTSSSRNSRRSTRISIRCSICQDTEDCREIEFLPCSHSFHSLCITEWLRRSSECPLCRVGIFSDVELVTDTIVSIPIRRTIIGIFTRMFRLRNFFRTQSNSISRTESNSISRTESNSISRTESNSISRIENSPNSRVDSSLFTRRQSSPIYCMRNLSVQREPYESTDEEENSDEEEHSDEDDSDEDDSDEDNSDEDNSDEEEDSEEESDELEDSDEVSSSSIDFPFHSRFRC